MPSAASAVPGISAGITPGVTFGSMVITVAMTRSFTIPVTSDSCVIVSSTVSHTGGTLGGSALLTSSNTFGMFVLTAIVPDGVFTVCKGEGVKVSGIGTPPLPSGITPGSTVSTTTVLHSVVAVTKPGVPEHRVSLTPLSLSATLSVGKDTAKGPVVVSSGATPLIPGTLIPDSTACHDPGSANT